MDKLGIDYKLFLAQVINFTIFFVIFKKFISKPFIEYINKERETSKVVENKLQEIIKLEKDYECKKNEIEERIKKQFEKALILAREESNKIRDEMTLKAKHEAELIIEKGRVQLQMEQEIAYKQTKERMANLSISFINKALNDYLTEPMKRDISINILNNYKKTD
jgi:F-type H+-transporting ATPase subunit b